MNRRRGKKKASEVGAGDLNTFAFRKRSHNSSEHSQFSRLPINGAACIVRSRRLQECCGRMIERDGDDSRVGMFRQIATFVRGRKDHKRTFIGRLSRVTIDCRMRITSSIRLAKSGWSKSRSWYEWYNCPRLFHPKLKIQWITLFECCYLEERDLRKRWFSCIKLTNNLFCSISLRIYARVV